MFNCWTAQSRWLLKKCIKGISCRDMVYNGHNAAAQSTSAEMRCIAYAASGKEWPWIQGRLRILNDTRNTAFRLCMLYRALLLPYPCIPRDDSSSISFMLMIRAMVDQVWVLFPIKLAWSLRPVFPPTTYSTRLCFRFELPVRLRIVSSGLFTV